ncbi:hypothetical protein [Archangium primigenium]|uniref:hypothetical protein n=1 Tax=[Archangium] primigenium TaxID=2792470 RepID=UPI0019597DBE|nr:hypothetical protein [Archangium primigenium]MBM7116396.1 hypothetical protein [Archangium primigenium]
MDTFPGLPLDLPTALSTLLFGALMVGTFAWQRFKARHQQSWRSALELLSLRLELDAVPGERDAFEGEYRDTRLWMGLQPRPVGSEDEQTLPTLRLDVGVALPRDFVAVPRAWTRVLDRVGLPGLFSAEDPVLDKRFVFQCDFVTPAQALVRDAGVREALSRLGSDDAVAFIEKNQVGLSFTRAVHDEASLRAHLEAMRAVASALRAALEATGGVAEPPRQRVG